MPSVTGFISEENKEEMEQLIEDGKFEDSSEFVEEATRYLLHHKY